MSLYRLTASLLNSWLRATDPDACGDEYADFLKDLGREQRPTSAAAKAGIKFEEEVFKYSRLDAMTTDAYSNAETLAIVSFGQLVRGACYQVRGEKEITVSGLRVNLVGVADFIHAGIITDIKRVQRYEYGKYQFSAQHPLYMEIFPEALRFDYLIFDGAYCYMEQYRRGDFIPIQQTAARFMDYLDGAGLMGLYQEKWREKE